MREQSWWLLCVSEAKQGSKQSASAKCSGAQICQVRWQFWVLARCTLPQSRSGVCSVYKFVRYLAVRRVPPPRLFGSLGSRRDDDEVGIVQRLFTIQRAVAGSGFPFSCPFYRSRPGGPEAVHGAVPGGSRTRSPQQSESRAVSSPSYEPQHRAGPQYSAYVKR